MGPGAGRQRAAAEAAHVLITLLRTIFVILAALIGSTSGQYFFKNVIESGIPPWFGAAIGFGVAVTLIAAEQAFRRRFTRSLVAFLIGLGGGLLLSALLLLVIRLTIQDDDLYRNLDLPLALITTYLVMITVVRSADRLRVIVPFVEFRGERIDGGALILDPQSLGDTRLPALLRAGLSAQRILLHRRALESWEARVEDPDLVERARARRALEGVQTLRQPGLPPLEIDDTEIPNAMTLADVVIRLTRLENGRLLTVDPELARRATAEGVAVVDLSAIAAAMVPDIGPGAAFEILIEKAGEGKGQGIGFLDDGSMVVVGEAATRVGQRIRVLVKRQHQTANGRMIFADPD